MKKLSFFLMAMLFSVMSFAAESLQVTMDFTKNTWGFPVGSANKTATTNTYTNGEYTITLAAGGSNGYYWHDQGYLLNGKNGATLTLPAFTFKTTKIVVTGRNGASASTKQNFFVGSTAVSTQTTGATGTYTYTIAADYQAAGNVYIYKVTSAHNTQITKIEIYGEAESGEPTETVNAPVFDVIEANFTKAFTLNITSEAGTTLKYTTDNTDPKTSATAVVVNTNTASIAIPAKSTAVKAVAVKGELMSVSASKVYCYVNSAATAYTVAEAMAVIDAGLGLENELYIKGTISKIESFNSKYGSITYWIEDEEGNEFECYSGLGLNKVKFTAKEDIELGAYVVACGIMKKYNSIYEFDYNNYLVEYVAPVVTEPTIDCKDALDFGAVVYTDEVAAQTLEVAGYNLTSDITVTLSEGAAFTVDQTTLSAEGGNLVVTPVSPLTVGTHTATLTLASGEATAEVTLTIVAKDVYTITWSVNGETSTTTVVEGDKLVLPAAPEAPEACSEKVFVGWTAAEEVNEDGSDIEWVTAATAPTAAATYYAVFAAQEGEGGAIETSVSVNIGEYASANSWTNQTQYLSMSIDENITATITEEGEYHNSGKYYENGTNWRIYQNESPTLTIAAAEGVTISTVAVTYAIQNTGILTLDGVNIESEAICEINAASVTFGVGNTGSAANGQVRVTKINVTYFAGAAATYTDYSTTCEAEIEWQEIPLEITNLVTEVMEVEGAKYLMMMGGNEEMEESVNIFLNNYADIDDDYEVNAESSLIVYMGYEFTVMEGIISQTSETEKGTLYTGTVSATGIVEGETMYVKFGLTMSAAPATVLVLTDAIVAINEKLETLTFNVPTGEGEGYFVELSGYTAPGVHEGPQICLFETPEVVAYATYVETEVVDGVITLKGEFASPMGAKFDLTISGTLPVVEPEVKPYATIAIDGDNADWAEIPMLTEPGVGPAVKMLVPQKGVVLPEGAAFALMVEGEEVFVKDTYPKIYVDADHSKETTLWSTSHYCPNFGLEYEMATWSEGTLYKQNADLPVTEMCIMQAAYDGEIGFDGKLSAVVKYKVNDKDYFIPSGYTSTWKETFRPFVVEPTQYVYNELEGKHTAAGVYTTHSAVVMGESLAMGPNDSSKDTAMWAAWTVELTQPAIYKVTVDVTVTNDWTTDLYLVDVKTNKTVATFTGERKGSSFDTETVYGEWDLTAAPAGKYVLKAKNHVAWSNVAINAVTLDIKPGTEVGTGFENIQVGDKAVKIVRDGQVFIIRDNKVFNILGQSVK